MPCAKVVPARAWLMAVAGGVCGSVTLFALPPPDTLDHVLSLNHNTGGVRHLSGRGQSDPVAAYKLAQPQPQPIRRLVSQPWGAGLPLTRLPQRCSPSQRSPWASWQLRPLWGKQRER